MKPTTLISLRAKNIGKPTESLELDEVPVVVAIKSLAEFLLKQEMGKRFEVVLARNSSDADVINQERAPKKASKLSDSTLSFLDEIFAGDDLSSDADSTSAQTHDSSDDLED